MLYPGKPTHAMFLYSYHDPRLLLSILVLKQRMRALKK